MLKKYLFLLLSLSFLAACGTNEQVAVNSVADLRVKFDQLNELNNDLESGRNQLYSLVREFNSGKAAEEQFDITSLDTLMGADEKTLLNAMFREEKDISYDGLLKVIIEKNNEIAELSQKIGDIEAKLPQPTIVQKGDTHYSIVREFLMTTHGLDKKQAREIAWRTSMIDDILPGNNIWLAYSDGIVGTYVTQGTAPIPPMSVQVFAKKRMIEKAYEEGRQQGKKEVDSLSTTISTEGISLQ